MTIFVRAHNDQLIGRYVQPWARELCENIQIDGPIWTQREREREGCGGSEGDAARKKPGAFRLSQNQSRVKKILSKGFLIGGVVGHDPIRPRIIADPT